jgi:hypothetical protein
MNEGWKSKVLLKNSPVVSEHISKTQGKKLQKHSLDKFEALGYSLILIQLIIYSLDKVLKLLLATLKVVLFSPTAENVIQLDDRFVAL